MVKNIYKNRIFRFNRRIRGLTNYNFRLRMLKSGLTRAVIRKSNKNILVQLVNYDNDGDKVLTSARSVDLIKYGFNINRGNIMAAYLTGYLAGKRALKLKKNEMTNSVIVDFGLQKVLYGNRLFAAVKGLVDSGVNVKVEESVFPSEERIKGVHLANDKGGQLLEEVKSSIDKI